MFNNFFIPNETLVGDASVPCTLCKQQVFKEDLKDQTLIMLKVMLPKPTGKGILGFLTTLLSSCYASLEWGKKGVGGFPTLSNFNSFNFKKNI